MAQRRLKSLMIFFTLWPLSGCTLIAHKDEENRGVVIEQKPTISSQPRLDQKNSSSWTFWSF